MKYFAAIYFDIHVLNVCYSIVLFSHILTKVHYVSFAHILLNFQHFSRRDLIMNLSLHLTPSMSVPYVYWDCAHLYKLLVVTAFVKTVSSTVWGIMIDQYFLLCINTDDFKVFAYSCLCDLSILVLGMLLLKKKTYVYTYSIYR